MTKKLNKTVGWTPVKIGDRTKACKRLEGREIKEETGNLHLHGESYLSSLCIIFS